MAARHHPETAILGRAVIEGPPEAEDGLRLRVEEGPVLVSAHLAPNPRLLEYIHGLHAERNSEAEVSANALNVGRVGYGLEDGVEVLERMADLIDALLGLLRELPLRVPALLLKQLKD